MDETTTHGPAEGAFVSPRENSNPDHGTPSHSTWDLKAVAWFNRIMTEGTDWKMVAPMILAAPFYQVGKVGALRFFLSSPAKSILGRSLSLAIAPVAVGFGLENTFFSLANRSLTHFTERPLDWTLASVARDWAQSGVSLGFLKGVGFLGRQGMMSLKGLEESTAAAWTRADHRALWFASQASGYLGLVGAHGLETLLGMRTPKQGGNIWLDTLGTHIALGLGTHWGRRLAGPHLEAVEQRLSAHAYTLLQQARDSAPSSGSFLSNFGLGRVPALAGYAGGLTTHRLTTDLEIREVFQTNEGNGTEGPAVILSSMPPPNGGHRSNALAGKYVVIGNRSEPAVRAIHTVKEMGGKPIVYVSDADKESLFATLDGILTLPLRGRSSNDTYMNIEARIGALTALMERNKIKAQDVIGWEGWGFLSENPDLFSRYEEMGIGIAGAPSKSHRLMGDKVSARRLAREAGVPIVEGSEEISSLEEGLAFARNIGFPVIIKGQATGGGSAIKEVHREEDFPSQYASAIREAQSTSGKASVFVEEFIPSMRHLEVQVIADGQGNYVILGERDCTVQRKSKKQKIIEEEVSNSLHPEIKAQAREIADKIMQHPEMKDYKGPGTIEIIWDAKSNKLYFMEMNTRLQVEHTVSEMVTGKNLLKAQLELGAGLPLSFTEAHPKGHSIEVRITAEDPFNNFAASTGRILYYREPHAHKTARIRVRVDSGIETGSVVTSDYDPMLAKLIVWGENRQHALEGLRNALDQFEILGVKTNIPFLKKLIDSETFKKGEVPDTNWVEDQFLKSDQGKPDYQHYPQALLTVAIQTFLQRKDALLRSKQDQLQGASIDPKIKLSFQGQNFETEVYEQGSGKYLVKVGSHLTEVGLKRSGEYLYNLQLEGVQRRVLIKPSQGWREVLLDNLNYPIEVVGEGDVGPGAVASPLPGKVWKVLVKPGDPIKKGDTLAIIEAMKVENAILADRDGTVKEVKVKEFDQVAERDLLMMLEVEGSDQPAVGEGSIKSNLEEDLRLGTALLQSMKDKDPTEILPEERARLMEQFHAYFMGYDSPIPELLEVLPKLRLPNGSSPPGQNRLAELQKFIGGLITAYQETEGLFTPARWAHWVRYRQMGIFIDRTYQERLDKVLTSLGVSASEPSPELEEVVYRLAQSHNRRREKANVLTELMPWISEYQMTELLPLLPSLARLYLDGVPKSFSNLVSEHQWKLEKRISGARENSSLEREFEAVLQGGSSRDKAIKAIFDHSDEVLSFLVRQALQRENPVARQHAFQLLQQYFYGSRYRTAEFFSGFNGHVSVLVPHPDIMAKGLQVDFSGIGGEEVTPEKFRNVLFNSLNRRNHTSDEAEHLPNRALNLVLAAAPENHDYSPYLNILNEVLFNPSVEQVTCIVQENPEWVGFHTFERSGETGQWQEVVALRGSHPMAAEERGLDRWEENFQITPSEQILANASNVLAYKLQAKNDRKDSRQLVIGEHRGRVTLERFHDERVENRLINDYRHLLSNPHHPLDQDSRIVWSWLPYALKEKGLASQRLDPFSFGVLAATPAELIKLFNINEAVLQEVASFYHDKVKSVPEVERVAKDTALAVEQIQDQSSPTVADIYIWQAVNLSDAEINLLAFRLAPNFIGKNLEKTTVHFKRLQDGKLKGYLAEIKVPGKTRFEVTIKEAKEDMPPHRVRTALERKRLKQQSRGKLYVYDHAGLIRDVVKEEFFPLGNAPTDAIRIQEMILGENGELVPANREIGENDLSKVAFEVTVPLPLSASGEKTINRSFMVIADDYTVRNGSMGRKEGQLHKAVSERAIEKGIPKLYIDESVGAFIGFAQELLPFIHHDTEKNIIFVRGSDLEQVMPHSDYKVIDLIDIGEPYGDSQFPVTSILGMGPINTESLNGSGIAGEAESRARAHVPTATIVLNPSVGIATYLGRLSEFIIMLKDSYLGLTGRKAVNNTFGTHYKSESEIAGTEVMADSGVAYKVVGGEREALRAFLRWISYQPVHMGQEAPRFQIGADDLQSRDIGPIVSSLMPKRGQTYDSKLLDRAVYDPGSVDYIQGDGYWGRRVNVGFATLGGISVGIASMEMSVKPYPGENEMMLYPGGLDGDSSVKLADHIAQVNRLGLPLIFNASITGFLPRREDHIEKRVIPGGARILDALREFRQPAIIWVPPHGFLYGGAWVVIDRNINPNVVMVADHSAQLGILGSAASNELPLVTDHHKTTEDKKLTRLMLDAQNTPQRALKVGSIHEVIDETGRTPAILYGLLEQKLAEIKQDREAKNKETALLRQVTGALDLMGVGYALLPEGKIEITFPEGTVRTGLESVRAGLTAHFHTATNPMALLWGKAPENKPSGDK